MYSAPNIIRVNKSRRIRWPEQLASMGERRDAHRVLVGRPEEKRSLGRHGHRWNNNNNNNNNEIELQEIGWRLE
jgi:hypothetical protein